MQTTRLLFAPGRLGPATDGGKAYAVHHNLRVTARRESRWRPFASPAVRPAHLNKARLRPANSVTANLVCGTDSARDRLESVVRTSTRRAIDNAVLLQGKAF